MVDAKLHVGRRLPEDLPVHLSARSDEGGDQSSRYARYRDASPCAPSACARALTSDLTTTCNVGTSRRMMLVDCSVYVCVVRVELWIPVHGVIVLYDM